MTSRAPIAVALDAPDLDTAAQWADLVTPHVSTLKVGLELYLRFGPEAVASVRGPRGVDVFLDLKLHDIPATVGGAARAVAKIRPDLPTVHAEVGPDITLVTPGVRPFGEASHDQARVATPQEALRDGADLLVIGRPITSAPDPGAAAAALATALRRRQPAPG